MAAAEVHQVTLPPATDAFVSQPGRELDMRREHVGEPTLAGMQPQMSSEFAHQFPPSRDLTQHPPSPPLQYPQPQAPVYAANAYGAGPSYPAQAQLVPSQAGFYHFDPAYVQSVPFGYYTAAPMQPMPQNFDYPQPPWTAQTPSAAPHVYPYRPLYIRQPPVDPYQVFDEEGNPLYLPQHGSPPVIAGAFAQTPTLYNGQGMYASGSSTPTLRATTSHTSRRSQNMSGLPSSDSLPSSEQGFTSSHNRTASRQYISPSNTVVPSARSANFNGQSGQKKASMRMPKAKQPPSDTLPRPPAHSDFALWVGNVPSDATHAEMWTFFTSRPAPRVEDLDNLGAPVSESDLDSNGVKSIHLITRTNCCFVNYASQRHLDFALSVCHGAPLRPRDPRSKELVCRIRHKEDSSRSGVGAQRSAGIHKSWVADHEQYRRQQEVEEQEKINSIEREAEEEVASTLSPMQSGSESTPLARAYHREKSSSTDRSTNSTSSSFLARYFAKRYFILKSHTGEELEQSRQTATWSTQAHNQPVLDRAYATAREGVFLFFSANGSGEFYGVARMDGSISQLRASSSSSRVASQSLTNLYPSNATAPNQSTILPQRLVAGSPQPVSPHPKDQPVSSHLKDQSVSPNPKELAAQESYLQAARNSLLRQRHNHTDPLPVVGNEDETIAERRGASLDTDRLAGGIRNLSVQENAPSVLAEAVADREESHLAGIASGPTSADSVFHYEYIQSPEERNARLESLPQETLAMPRDPSAVGPCGAAGVQTRSPPFTIEWLSTKSVNFTKTRHLRNAFNKLKEIKVSRDGTELDPVTGESVGAHTLWMQ